MLCEGAVLPFRVCDMLCFGSDLLVVCNGDSLCAVRWEENCTSATLLDTLRPLLADESGIVSIARAAGRASPHCLVALGSGAVLLWDRSSERVLQTFRGCHLGPRPAICRPCFGGEGDEFVAAADSEGRTCVWQRSSGRLVTVLPSQHLGSVNALAWGVRDGDPLLASGGDDRRIV